MSFEPLHLIAQVGFFFNTFNDAVACYMCDARVMCLDREQQMYHVHEGAIKSHSLNGQCPLLPLTDDDKTEFLLYLPVTQCQPQH